MNGTNCNTDERGLLPYPVILAATKYGVDEDLRERLQSKLMRAVLSFKADK